MQANKLGIQEYFKQIPDPCDDSGKHHQLEDILTITTLAVICGADDWQSIEDYGHAQEEFLKQFLSLPHGVLSNVPTDVYLLPWIAGHLNRCFRMDKKPG